MFTYARTLFVAGHSPPRTNNGQMSRAWRGAELFCFWQKLNKIGLSFVVYFKPNTIVFVFCFVSFEPCGINFFSYWPENSGCKFIMFTVGMKKNYGFSVSIWIKDNSVRNSIGAGGLFLKNDMQARKIRRQIQFCSNFVQTRICIRFSRF